MYIKIRFKLFYSFLILFVSTGPVFSSDDAYLQALEAEAESSVDAQNTIQPAAGETKSSISDRQKLQIINQQRRQEFEKKLSGELPASTRTYNKLSHKHKMKVVDAYYDSGKNMSAATRLLFNLYFKHKTSNQ